MDDEGRRVSRVAGGVDGRDLLEAIRVATSWLAGHRDAINALNVFPVPDGDTGTNMLLTLREAVAAGDVAVQSQKHAGAIALAIAQGAFVGARGNSGVILCQMIRGFANAIADKATIDGNDLATALAGAREQAYRAVLEPVEGTMLTVIRVAAEAARAVVDGDPTGTPELNDVVLASLQGARDALAKTPDLLDILRQANVVDAGGQGVVHILEGFAHLAAGAAPLPVPTEPEVAAPLGASMAFLDTVVPAHGDGDYGYCVNFVVLADGELDFDAARLALGAFGDSVEVIGDARALRVHVHTENPGPILGHAVRLGKLDRIQIENMELQTQRLAQEREVARSAPAPPPSTLVPAEVDPEDVAVLTIAPGPGLAAALKSMGAAGVIAGGQTMNPSTAELLAGINALANDRVILLPNNPNIFLTAEQAATMTDKAVAVVPTRSVPQGLAALAALSPAASLEENTRRMTRALDQVRTVEVTRAIRDAIINEVSVRKDQAIGFVDDRLVATGSDIVAVAAEAVVAADLGRAELVTIFTGADLGPEAAVKLQEAVLAAAPDLTVEIHEGGQPHYPFVVSVE